MIGNKDQEIEVKFYLNDLTAIKNRLKVLHANCIQPRTHEYNLRFDDKNETLSRDFRLLRLRKDAKVHLTYKGPSITSEGVIRRQEIEFTLSDFDTARRLLTALDYQVIFIYEKYRTSYSLADSIVTLDEMPLGPFVEIEGKDQPSIQFVAQKLDLNWENRILVDYLTLFNQLKNEQGLKMRDLTFENFKTLHITAKHMRIRPADSDHSIT
jgi:adenylate cyclase class 2